MRYYVTIIALACFLACSTKTALYAQCNATLVEVAAAKSGISSVYIKEFKAKLKAGTARNPTPAAKFPTLLNKGINYQFTLANAQESEGQAILQLFDRGRMLGTTLQEGRNYEKFNIVPERTGVYRVVISFLAGKAGCAAGVLSMVLHDTTQVFDTRVNAEEREQLYIGVDNTLNIAASGVPGGTLEVTIDQGTVQGSQGQYIVRVNRPGIALLTVTSRDSLGNIKETHQTEFWVTRNPKPTATLAGLTGGLVTKTQLLAQDGLYLDVPEETYTVVSFSVFINDRRINQAKSRGRLFSAQQRALLQQLTSGDRLYIKPIKAKSRDGTAIDLQPLGFIIE